jgi:formylglycine-generating enzyme required for sulfatase activity
VHRRTASHSVKVRPYGQREVNRRVLKIVSEISKSGGILAGGVIRTIHAYLKLRTFGAKLPCLLLIWISLVGGFSQVATAKDVASHYALVVGNGAYRAAHLATPAVDAAAVARQLKTQGYDVALLRDATGTQLRAATADFKHRLQRGQVGFFYYSGRFLTATGETHLLGTDFVAGAGEAASAVSVGSIVTSMATAGRRISNVVVLHLQGEGSPVSVAAPSNFSITTVHGDTVAQGAPALSSFAAAFLAELGTPDQRVETVFRNVRAALEESGRPIVRNVSSVGAEVTLAPSPGSWQNLAYATRGIRVSSADRRPAKPAGNAGTAEESRGIKIADSTPTFEFSPKFERDLWAIIKNSQNAADFEAYLDVFPKGAFAAEAKKRLTKLRADKAEKAPATPKAAAPPKAAEKIELIWKRYEAVKNLELRAEPDAKAKVVGSLERGKQILVVGRIAGRDWYKVNLKAGQFAYAARSLLRAPAAPAQKAPPRKAPVNTAESFQDCPECPEMVRIVAGQFKMGSTTGDRSERPVRSVRIAKSFAIGKYEVTVAQWQACVKSGGCTYSPSLGKAKPNDPVRKLSWSDVMRYVAWLRKKTGQRYRLPTEAEWEYAARAGSESLYWWGDRMAPGLADCKKCDPSWNRKLPQSVGRDKANPFGLHGVAGGVWEWTADCWHNNYASAPADGRAWDAADCRSRVLRGGSWRNDANYARAASRLKYDFDVRYSTNGFRVARELR